MIRTPAKDISVIGRATKGVIVMRLRDGGKVAAVAIAPHEEVEEEPGADADNAAENAETVTDNAETVTETATTEAETTEAESAAEPEGNE